MPINRKRAARLPGATDSNLALRDRLTATEIRLIPYTLMELSVKEIAHAVRSTPRSVKAHISNIYRKYNVHTRRGLLAHLGHFEIAVKWIPHDF